MRYPFSDRHSRSISQRKRLALIQASKCGSQRKRLAEVLRYRVVDEDPCIARDSRDTALRNPYIFGIPRLLAEVFYFTVLLAPLELS